MILEGYRRIPNNETSKEDDANNIPTRSGNMYRMKDKVIRQHKVQEESNSMKLLILKKICNLEIE